MQSERRLPTEEERNEYNQRLDNTLRKSRIAAETTIAFAAASIAFPPALPGAVVTAGETLRQTIKLSSDAIQFHRKYRRADRK